MSIEKENISILDNKDLVIIEKTKEIERIKKELSDLKEYFGYESDQTIEEIEEQKIHEDEEEKQYREDDEEYDNDCKRGEELSDLVIELSEKQFESSGLNNRLKKLVKLEDQEVRKNFFISFNKLKNVITREEINEFYDIISEWIDIQKDMYEIDEKIRSLSD